MSRRRRPATRSVKPRTRQPCGPGRQRPIARSALPGPAGRLALESLAPALFALLYVGLAYDVWDPRLAVPLYAAGPTPARCSRLGEGHRPERPVVAQPGAGAPFGLNYHDFPFNGETPQMLVIKAAMECSAQLRRAVNIYYLSGSRCSRRSPLLILRHLRFPFAIAAIVALAYTFLPYHIFHQQSHLFRSTYVTAPLGFLLLVWALSWRSHFLRIRRPTAASRPGPRAPSACSWPRSICRLDRRDRDDDDRLHDGPARRDGDRGRAPLARSTAPARAWAHDRRPRGDRRGGAGADAAVLGPGGGQRRSRKLATPPRASTTR